VSPLEKCTKCFVQNCTNCDLNRNKCYICDLGFKRSWNGDKCEQIMCKNGKILDGYECVCPIGYFIDDNGTCSKCSLGNCVNCPGNVCY
jgi:hypothetical protein